ncbi:hypothetical protein AB0M28_32685, partial [Streptomyces sp. NPDC051940]|uniref:hypothetical protein n=1 Tax=Streptomyces sp. NPDC051940 TaxID=3155675 RepID=UPI00341EA642
MRFAATAASAAVLAALLSACTGADPAPPEKSASPAPAARAVTAAHSLTNGLHFPLERYEISDADQRVLEEARDRLTEKCMAGFGLDYVPVRERRPAGVGPYTYLYGVDDPVLAAEYGYADPRSLDPAVDAPARERELTADEELALYGDQSLGADEVPVTLEQARAMKGPVLGGREVPVIGCFGEAGLLINRPGADFVHPTVLTDLAEEAAQESNADPRVKALLAEWSRCMADHGYRTADPLTAREDLGLAGDARQQAAVQAAVQDVACKKETDLVRRWAAVDAEYQKRVIAGKRAMLELFAKQHEERMARAAAYRRRTDAVSTRARSWRTRCCTSTATCPGTS